MSATGHVSVLSEGGTHHSWCWNEKNMVWRQNVDAVDLESGHVVVRSGSGAVRCSTDGAVTVVGVVPQVELADGSLVDQNFHPIESGYVQFVGDIAKVNVVGAVAIGDFLISSTTVGRAKSCGITWQPGVFARANSAAAGPEEGAVTAWLFPVHSQVAPWKPGDIKMQASDDLETGWLWCNGDSLLRTDYAALFAKISTKYGASDGDHFNVPDLRGRIPVGVGTHADVNDFGKNEGQPTVANRTPKHAHTVARDGWGTEGAVGGLIGRLVTTSGTSEHAGANILTGTTSVPFLTVKFVIKT